MTWEREAKLCSRCGGHWRFGFSWPEGYVCRSCVYRSGKLFGRCPSCGHEGRFLMGRHQGGRPVCVECAGITTCFRCSLCQLEGLTWYSRTCVACSLRRRVSRVLDDGTGEVAPSLGPLFERLSSMANPMAAMTWLNKPEVRARLSSLARGKTPLSHEGIDSLAGPQGREFLRELLVEVGLLPKREKYLAAFESWRPRRLASIDDAESRREVGLYLAWRHSRYLAVRAEAGRLGAGPVNLARDQTDAAVRFLKFLSSRGHSLAELSQADVDDWFSTASNPMRAVDFLVFSMAHRRCARVRLPQPARKTSPGSPLSRLSEIVRRLTDDDSLALSDRVAGLIVLLFAQPVTRVAALRLDDVIEGDGVVTLALGDEPVVLPEAVAALVWRYLGERSRTNTTNTTTSFLFPGGRPGYHVTAAQLRMRLNQLGITKRERQGALTHLLSEVPSAVVAKATGYSSATTAARAARAGTDWAGLRRLETGGREMSYDRDYAASGSPFNRSKIVAWFSLAVASTTRGRRASSVPGSALMLHAWTTWRGFDGQRGSCATPVGMRAAGC